MNSVTARIWKCVRLALPKAGKNSFWLLKIILPVTLLVRFLQYSGLLGQLTVLLEPFFAIIGLPGETAVVFITSIFTPLYTSIALITTLSLGVREATILALMCLISHNLLVESSVQAKTGSKFWEMTLLRLVMSFVVAFTMNRLLPAEGWGTIGRGGDVEVYDSIGQVFTLWFISSMKVILLIIVIVTALMIFHYLMEEFRLMEGLSGIFAPLMKLFGLSPGSAFLWLVGNMVGLAYGGAIMMEQVEQKKLTRKEGNLLNYHLAINHSLLEDTLIFVAIGIPALWIILPRIIFAVLVVWMRRIYNYVCVKKLNISHD